jgi:DNA processing protein
VPAGKLLDWIALNLLPGLGPRPVHRLLERCGDPGEIAHRVPEAILAATPGLGAKTAAAIAGARSGLTRRAELELRRAEKLGVRLLLRGEADYPPALETIHDPPYLLYVRGELRLDAIRIAIVGSRRATRYGQRVATGLGLGLAARGAEIVSGGARGIDTCAHLGALEEGGRTIAVLGSGLDDPYPAENRSLFERIAEHGALVSEFPLGREPRPENFPRRNRIISGLSAAVVVVEAARRSGSLVTAGHALDQGREVLAIPGPVDAGRSEGCHRLIQDGASLVQNLDDIVAELPPDLQQALAPRPLPAAAPAAGGSIAAAATSDEEAVLGLLDEVEPLQLDALAERAPFGIARLQAALFGLELRGAIEVLPGRSYLRLPGGSAG